MTQRKGNVLLITRNLPPLVGGMENLLNHCATAVGRDYSLTVVGPRGCGRYLEDGVEVLEASSSLAGFLIQAPFLCLRVALGKKFDLLIGGSGLMAPCLLLLRTIMGIPSLCFVHGLDIVVASRVYQWLFLPCIRRVDSVIANSSNTKSLCIEAGIEPSRLEVIHPGCDIPELERCNARATLDREYDVGGSFCVLFVGRMAPRKGLLQFMKKGFGQLLQYRPDTVLIVAGDSPNESLAHKGGEMDALVRLVAERDWARHVKFLGKVDDSTLSTCYGGADCLLFPLVPVPGDVEGFGMVAIEAAAHGTQTVAFAEGGVSDAIDNGVSGYLITSGDYSAMVHALVDIAPTEESVTACRDYASGFRWEVFDEKLQCRITKTITD
jgi:phosphatidyl-myo-inositol dimannoside synthase